MIKNIVRKMTRAALVASIGMLSVTAAQAAEVNKTAPEVGHVDWNWWQHATATTPAQDTVSAAPTHTPEIGHIGWLWWDNQLPSATAEAPSVAAHSVTPALGHVAWQWWNGTPSS